MAGLKGITNPGYERYVFYSSFANYNGKLQAASIKNAIYPNYDIVYLLESGDGTVIARGSVEFLDAIYNNLIMCRTLSKDIGPLEIPEEYNLTALNGTSHFTAAKAFSPTHAPLPHRQRPTHNQILRRL